MGSFLFLFMLTLCVSCDDYDTWTTSPSALLTLSEDTIAFDTLITDEGSTTKTLIASNKGDKGLRIRRVALGQGKESLFHVNVDGQYLYNGVGEDFEVRRKDSIYVRIEVRLPISDSDSIHAYQDELQFTLESGATQKVLLTASGMDVVILRGEVITTDRTLDATRPYQVFDSLVVAQGDIWANEYIVANSQTIPQLNSTLDRHIVANDNIILDESVGADIAVTPNLCILQHNGELPDSRSIANLIGLNVRQWMDHFAHSFLN